ncbi:hypothetical protein DSC45_29815 [Streptomyces sp. YIM 130001]|uniref:DUF6479 family protein n=1 Tax=Streptomyces sp. YIM 130001 TaxID=2259644 RepID=UPI000E65B580|nr:DUF6479 family protein [Streptomyces sp. YIM 130001]RII09706.1 hypothetical protein DSC45_29815 [Streptomyces sp. YIM 130001]
MTAYDAPDVTHAAAPLLRAADDPSLGFVPFLLIGLVVAAALVWAVWLGIRIRRREPRPPNPGEQPRPPKNGAAAELPEEPAADDFGADGERLSPHEMRGHGAPGGRPHAGRHRKSGGSGGNHGT